MLTCIYHPLDPMRVVEADEAEKLMATGVWFDSPATAKDYRTKVEKDIKNEKSLKVSTPRKKPIPAKDKLEEQSNERKQDGSI